MLNIEDVCKSYGGLQVLRNVSFTIGRDETVAVIGPNGAGKTTLLNILTGCDRLDGGQVWLGEHRLAGLAVEKIASLGVARTFQGIRLFRRSSVYENARAGYRSRAERGPEKEAEAIDRALNCFGLAGRNTPAGELSAGEQRRLEVAKATLRLPKLLLLDEPFTGATLLEAAELARQIRASLAPGSSIMVIDHRPAVLSTFCDRFIVLHLGEKIFDGSWAELKNDSRVVEAYLGTERLVL